MASSPERAPVAATAVHSLEENQASDCSGALSRWRSARAELEDVDADIHDLRRELQLAEAKREEIAAREVALRREAEEAGHAADVEAELAGSAAVDASLGAGNDVVGLSCGEASDSVGEVIFKPAGNNSAGKPVFEVLMTPRVQPTLVMTPTKAGSPDEPAVFPMEESPEGTFSSGAGPTRHRLSVTATSPEKPRNGAQAGPAGGEGGSTTPRSEEDWEQGLDVFGVAKCGVCGMKLPLDVPAIEQHSIECEAALREGRKPNPISLDATAATDVAAPPPLAKAAGPAAAVSAAVAALAARATAGRAGGVGQAVPAGGGSPAARADGGGCAGLAAPPSSKLVVGDRAVAMRSRMQQNSSQPRASAKWRGF